MRTFFLLIFIVIGFFSFGQENISNRVTIDKKDVSFWIDYPDYFVDSTRTLSFEEIKNNSFFKSKNVPIDIQSTLWRKIYLTPKVKTEFLLFAPHYADISYIYVPYKTGYKEFITGMLSKKKVKVDVLNSKYLQLPIDSINFKKPFYYNKLVLTQTGKNYIPLSGFAILSDNPSVWAYKNFIDSHSNHYVIYLSIIFVSFLLFFVNYIISKDKNFLNYSIYLLFTLLIFIRLLPYFHNLFIDIHPLLNSYIGTASSVMASAAYFYFVIYFIDAKNDSPKIYTLTKYTIIVSCIFSIFIIIQIIFIPYFPFRFLMLTFYNVSFLIISVVVFIYLIFSPLSKTKRIVVLGSVILILGQLSSIIFNNAFYFLNTVIAEIIVFSGVVSYQNRITHNKQILSESTLEIEKSKRENLQELDIAKSNFFTNISHEFRTPLTLISGPIQQQLNKKNLSNSERSNFEMVNRNTNRLLSLVDQLLDISKAESGDLKLQISKNELASFVGALTDSFSFRTKEKSIDYKINIEPIAIDSWFDKDVLEKIITNLISNAVKYTPENGKIECNTLIKDNNFSFIIKNSGKGMSKEQLEKVFNRFYQISEDNKGTGIGLALVKELVTLHKGTINAESISNDWTTFTVQIPISKKAYKENEITIHKAFEVTEKQTNYIDTIYTESNDDSSVDEDNPILLIVDDNEDIRTYISSIFKSSHTIFQAQNGQEGIEIAIEKVPDIIISDIMMPIKNGIELCNTLKVDERTSHIPIILLTAKVGEENEIEGVKTGADDYITKPFNNELLKLKVEKLLENIKKLQERFSQEVFLRSTEISISSTDDLFLNRLQDILDDKLVESTFNTDDFCKSINMSRMQLHRKLKALFNMTTSEFIRSQRLKLAADLLKTSDVTVSQVGYSVGFNDPAYFSKRFKEVYNCTPTQYAKRDE